MATDRWGKAHHRPALQQEKRTPCGQHTGGQCLHTSNGQRRRAMCEVRHGRYSKVTASCKDAQHGTEGSASRLYCHTVCRLLDFCSHMYSEAAAPSKVMHPLQATSSAQTAKGSGRRPSQTLLDYILQRTVQTAALIGAAARRQFECNSALRGVEVFQSACRSGPATCTTLRLAEQQATNSPDTSPSSAMAAGEWVDEADQARLCGAGS